jgi:hypothetical protein
MGLLSIPNLKPVVSIIGTDSLIFVKLGMNGVQLGSTFNALFLLLFL